MLLCRADHLSAYCSIVLLTCSQLKFCGTQVLSLDMCKTSSKVFKAEVLVHARTLGLRRSKGLDLKLCNCSEYFKVVGNKTIINVGFSHLS